MNPLALVLKWLGGGVLDRVLKHLETPAASATERERIRTAVTVEEIKAELERRRVQADVVKAELGTRIAWLPRFLIAMTAAFFLMAHVVDAVWQLPGDVAPIDGSVAAVLSTVFAAMFMTGR